MYFFVKYIDYEDFKKTVDTSSTAESLSNVSIAQNKELTVNPNCYIGIILDYIYKEAGVDDTRCNFDLATEKGKALNVNNYQPDYSGLGIFSEKATYYIAYRSSQDQLMKPLLNKASKEYLDFLAYQRRRSSMGKRRSGGSKASSSSKTSRATLQSKDRRSSSKSTKSLHSRTKSHI